MRVKYQAQSAAVVFAFVFPNGWSKCLQAPESESQVEVALAMGLSFLLPNRSCAKAAPYSTLKRSSAENQIPIQFGKRPWYFVLTGERWRQSLQTKYRRFRQPRSAVLGLRP